MSFVFQLKQIDGREVLFLSGSIDEAADFSKIETGKQNYLVMDLGGIKMLNSIGLRSWVMWMKSVQKSGGFFVRNCPSIAINQINILKGFMPLSTVFESIQVPFFCESCTHPFVYTATRGQDYFEATEEGSEKVTMELDRPCPNCGKSSSADVIPSKYFKFLQRHKI